MVKSYLHSARVLYNIVNTYVTHTLTEISISFVTMSDHTQHSGNFIVFYGRVKGEINGRTHDDGIIGT